MFNTVKPLSIVSERSKNKQMQENVRYGKVIYFELFGENCMKIVTAGQVFLSNYEFSRYSK
jgi:hypothetical protein